MPGGLLDEGVTKLTQLLRIAFLVLETQKPSFEGFCVFYAAGDGGWSISAKCDLLFVILIFEFDKLIVRIKGEQVEAV